MTTINLENDLIIGGIIFIIIILIRSIISNHGKGGIAGALIIFITGIIFLKVNQLYGELIILMAIILLIITFIEHKKDDEIE